jgi:hypothetical protein
VDNESRCELRNLSARAVRMTAIALLTVTAYAPSPASADAHPAKAVHSHAVTRNQNAHTNKRLCPQPLPAGQMACHAIVASVPVPPTAPTAVAPPPIVVPQVAHSYPHKRVCSRAVRRGQMACHALVRTDPAALPGAISRFDTPPGYGPGDLRSAYNLTATGSSSETVAVVDAYDDPNAESDLATYRAQYQLPACTTANGCFKKADERGGSAYPAPDPGWAGEISLDLDMVSAACPGCHILLVEASSDNLSDLGAAVNEAVALGAKFVSNSYGGPEDADSAIADAAYFNHPGVAITASSGDSGYGAEFPASSQYVTAVGGTTLISVPNARGWTESVWSTSSTEGTASGCSTVIPKPAWQTDTGCQKRTVGDVAAVADPDTGVAVYDSYQAPGWSVYGGTSVAAPLIAGVYALAGTPGRSDYPARYPYQHTHALWDVTSGSNGTCSPTYLCTAGPGYDGPTGWGAPNGVGAFAASGTGNVVTVVSPGPQSGVIGTPASLQIHASDTGSSTLAFSATGLPPGLSIAATGLISGTPTTLGTYSVTVTATDATGATGSATFGWSILASTSLVNGGFESGDTRGWAVAGVAQVNRAARHSGVFGLQLGSPQPSSDSAARQTFTAASGSSVLSFYYDVTCPDSVAFDWAEATLTDTTTRMTTTVLPPTCAQNSGWTKVSTPVIAGHQYTLVLFNHDDGFPTDPTYTYFDDVTVS